MPKIKSVPAPAERRIVKSMAALGVSRDLIAKRVGLSEDELIGRFGEDLRTALPEMRAMVGAGLFAKAKAGNITAIIFWLKTRGGWSETIYREISESEEAAPARLEPTVILPCNGRNRCPRTERRLAGLERLLLKLEAKLETAPDADQMWPNSVLRNLAIE